ncbi:MAG: hypothetical protein M0R74_19110, partial [Dehalococcoidia bacterium]|nr:hypothetical protein [Dehalococcoidia bacterium]
MPLPRPRLALASLLLSFLAVIIALNPGADGRARAEEYDGIAGVALKYVGQHGGQCWTFVQKVVREATGKRMGFDYRQGYFDAGAVEVSLEEARAGDVIQIIGDYTGPDAEDRGMHTAIVLENHGNGKFEVVDSNHNWDEMVTRHDDYNPAEAAKESGLNVHVYRFDGGTATPPVLPPAPREPSDPATLRPGDTVVVVT